MLLCEQGCDFDGMAPFSKLETRLIYRVGVMNCEQTCTFDTGLSSVHRRFHVDSQCCSSLNRVMELGVEAGYSSIFFIGHDMGTGTSHFFEGDVGALPGFDAVAEKYDSIIASGYSKAVKKLTRNMQSSKWYKNVLKRNAKCSDKRSHFTSIMGVPSFVPGYCLSNGIACVNLSEESMLRDAGLATVNIRELMATS